MSIRLSDHALSQKISSIKDTLCRLNSHYSREETEESPFQNYLENKYSFRFNIPDSPLDSSSESPVLRRSSIASGLKNSYSVDDLKFGNELEDPLNSPPYSSENKPGAVRSHQQESGPAQSTGLVPPLEYTLAITEESERKKEQTMRGELDESRRILLARDEEISMLNARLNQAKAAEETHERVLREMEKEFQQAQKKQTPNEQLKNAIHLLETKAKQLTDENSVLHRKLDATEKEIQQYKQESYAKEKEVSGLTDKYTLARHELLLQKKEQIKIIEDLKHNANKSKNEVGLLKREKETLQIQITNLKGLLNTSKCTADKENLIDFVYENKANQNKTALKATSDRTYLKGRANSVSGGRTRSKSPILSRPIPVYSETRASRLISLIMKELSVATPKQLLSTVKTMHQGHRVAAHQKHFIEKIKELIVNCSPPGTITVRLSLKKIWKWVKRLLEEYLNIKIEIDCLRNSFEILENLRKALKVTSAELVPRAIGKNFKENERLLVMLSKLKVVFSLPDKCSLDDLELEINNRL